MRYITHIFRMSAVFKRLKCHFACVWGGEGAKASACKMFSLRLKRYSKWLMTRILVYCGIGWFRMKFRTYLIGGVCGERSEVRFDWLMTQVAGITATLTKF